MNNDISGRLNKVLTLHLFSKLEKKEDKFLTFKGGVAAISKPITEGPSVSQRTFAYLKSRWTSCMACKAEALWKQARTTYTTKVLSYTGPHLLATDAQGIVTC